MIMTVYGGNQIRPQLDARLAGTGFTGSRGRVNCLSFFLTAVVPVIWPDVTRAYPRLSVVDNILRLYLLATPFNRLSATRCANASLASRLVAR